MGSKLRLASFGAVLAAIFFFLFKSALEPGMMLFGHDMLIIYLPFRIFADYMFKVFHDLPLWFPNLFFGMPMIASSSLLYYYPTDLLFMLLGIDPRFSATPDIMIHMYAAFIGMYLFLRRENLSREASFLGGIFIMLAGYTLSFINAGHINNLKAGALIPLVFYFIRSGLLKNSLKHYLAAGLVMGLQIMATGMQIMAYTIIGAAFFVIYNAVFEEKDPKKKLHVFLLFAAASVFSILFSFAQFLPSYDYKDFSWRGDFTYENFISWSQHPLEAIGMLFPHMFGLKDNNYFGFMSLNLTTYFMGIMPFLMLPFAFMFKKERRTAYFWLTCALIFLLLSFGGFTPLYWIFYKIPVYNQFRNPSRFMYQFSFFIAALAALGFDSMIKSAANTGPVKFLKITGTMYASLSVILIISLAAGMPDGIVKTIYSVTKKAQIPDALLTAAASAFKTDIIIFCIYVAGIIASAWLLIRGKIKSALIAVLILSAAHFYDIYRVEKEFVTYVDKERFIPAYQPAAEVINNSKERGRLADFSYSWGPNTSLYYNVEAIKGGHGMQPAVFGKMESSGMFNQIALDRALNIRWYASGSDMNFPGFVKRTDGRFKLYEDTQSKPRVTFTSKYLKMASADECLVVMTKGLFNGNVALVDFEPPFASSVLDAKGSLQISDYSPNELTFKTNITEDGFAQVSNLYYKRIKAKVDGKNVKVYRINYAFTGVFVPRGSHSVTVYYDRTIEVTGIIVSLLSLAGFITVCLYRRKIKA